MVHFGNRTNNRIENANGLLKKVTCHRDRLVTCIQKVWKHANYRMKDAITEAAYGCHRRIVASCDPAVQQVLSRMTTYASNQVLRHLLHRTIDLDSEEIEEGVVCCMHKITL
jgi:hypothetical protein